MLVPCAVRAMGGLLSFQPLLHPSPPQIASRAAEVGTEVTPLLVHEIEGASEVGGGEKDCSDVGALVTQCVAASVCALAFSVHL